MIMPKEGLNELRIYREGDYLLLIQLCGTETSNDTIYVKFVPGTCDRISSCIGAVRQKSQIFVSGINCFWLLAKPFACALPNTKINSTPLIPKWHHS